VNAVGVAVIGVCVFVAGFLTGALADQQERFRGDDDKRVFLDMVRHGCQGPVCDPNSYKTRCGPELLHWEIEHEPWPSLQCMYDGGTFESCHEQCR
jgi:hypothetical protein